MKKFVGCLLLFLFVGTVGCFPTFHYLIVGVDLRPIELVNPNSNNYNSYHIVTEFKNKIIFSIGYELEPIAHKINLKRGIECYATSNNSITYDNPLQEDTFSMFFDKDFIYGNKTIEAGMDILQDPVMAREINIIDIPLGYSGFLEFSDAFSQKASFDGEPYCVYFLCKTSDGITLYAQTTVKFPAN